MCPPIVSFPIPAAAVCSLQAFVCFESHWLRSHFIWLESQEKRSELMARLRQLQQQDADLAAELTAYAGEECLLVQAMRRGMSQSAMER